MPRKQKQSGGFSIFNFFKGNVDPAKEKEDIKNQIEKINQDAEAKKKPLQEKLNKLESAPATGETQVQGTGSNTESKPVAGGGSRRRGKRSRRTRRRRGGGA
jgi:hypothetical protein